MTNLEVVILCISWAVTCVLSWIVGYFTAMMENKDGEL